MPQSLKEPIAPVHYGEWFLPSGWLVKLASQWEGLPNAFNPEGPEYCSVLYVDTQRMVHAAVPVRATTERDGRTACPPLAGSETPRSITLGTAHSHQTPAQHGERISAADAALGSPVLVKIKTQVVGEERISLETSLISVDFYSPGSFLSGVNPANGQTEPIPAQSALFVKTHGSVHVFMWTPSKAETAMKELEEAAIRRSSPPAHCNPDDFWLGS